jgi:hypothetical protein
MGCQKITNVLKTRVARCYIFKPKIATWVNFVVLQWKRVVYFTAVWSILRPFGIFGAIWYIFSRFGILYLEKSGNPVEDFQLANTSYTSLTISVLNVRTYICALFLGFWLK